MKIAMLQCNPVSGDLAGNAARLEEFARRAQGEGARLCVGSAGALAGPDPGQYLNAPGARAAIEGILRDMARSLADGPALLVTAPTGVCMLRDGGVMRIMAAIPGKAHILLFERKALGIILGPESWPGGVSVPDLLIRILSAPYYPGSLEAMRMELRLEAGRLGVMELAVNSVGGNDGRISAGQSLAVDRDGQIFGQAETFAPDILAVDCARGESTLAPAPESRQAELWGALLLGLADFAGKSGVGRAVLGLSGGLDSALVACAAAEALGPANVLAVLMPSPHTSQASIDGAMLLARNLGLRSVSLPIGPLMRAYEETLAPALDLFPRQPGDMVAENIQARIRGSLLANLANRARALVLNTGNKSECAMGYFTLYGDAVGALGVIADLTKTQVRELALWLNESRGREIIPDGIISRPPTAELAPGQKDEDSLPPYERLDPALDAFLRNPETENPLFADAAPGSPRHRLYASEFKRRQSPPALLLSDCPFGHVWRVPVCGRLTGLGD